MTRRITLHVPVGERIGNDAAKCHEDVGFDRRVCIFIDRNSCGCVGDIDEADAVFDLRICDNVFDRRRDVDEFIFGMGFYIELSHFFPLQVSRSRKKNQRLSREQVGTARGRSRPTRPNPSAFSGLFGTFAATSTRESSSLVKFIDLF